ncbi:MAG TPA: hypothetical protein VGJ77_15015 [Gaiellaceae bacterium]
MTTPDLYEELRQLEGKFVAVSFHPTGEWNGSVLHAQGQMQQDVVDQPEGGVAFGIGKPRRRNNDWAELEIMWDDVESVAWRRDLLENGRPALAVTMRGGCLITIVP